MVFSLAVLLTACSRSPTVRFYTLSETQVTPTAGVSELAVSVGPAQFPRALARNQIVTRAGDTQLKVDEYNVWAAPLEAVFLRVLGDNIATRLGSDRVGVYPAGELFDVDYKVLLDVMQFDGVLGESVSLRVRWAIMQSGAAVTVKTFSDTQPVAEGDDSYDALVAAYSVAVDKLSQGITAELVRLSQAGAL
jgi:uncharacterized lipoprotein YmbA